MKDRTQKYGIITAVSMVVGSVIGSGVFFKTESINKITDGNVFYSVTAWIVGAIVMVLCLLAFAQITSTCGEKGGIYAVSKSVNSERYSRFAGVFAAMVYYPSLVSVLAYLTAKYTFLTIGGEDKIYLIILSFVFLSASFLHNALSPYISGKVQVVTTILKLVPLFLMITLGIQKGELASNLGNKTAIDFKTAFFPSVTATLFAYEGWISATSIGKNLENSRKNLPLALVIGGIIISMVYILYYLGIMGAVKSETLINYGSDGIKIAFSNIVGKWGSMLSVFVAISCYGALNSLVMGCGNSTSEVFDKNMKTSYFAGFIVSFLWLLYLITDQNISTLNFRFDSTELPVVTMYAIYIPIFFGFAKKKKKTKTTILCIGGIIASLFAVVCGMLAHIGEIASYMVILSAIFLLCSAFGKKTPPEI